MARVAHGWAGAKGGRLSVGGMAADGGGVAARDEGLHGLLEAGEGVVGVGCGGGAGGDGGEAGVEEGIADEIDEGGWADSAEGGEDEGEVVTAEGFAAGGVFGNLLCRAGGEDVGGGDDGVGEVGGEEGAGEGGVDGERAGAVGGGEDGVDLAAGVV